jgi:ribosomal protein S18 acetylase RimI-like enzyme
MTSPTIVPLANTPDTCTQLAEILVETVAHGGSVTFMHPLPFEEAKAFWAGSLADAWRGGRLVLGAQEDGVLVGTLTLLLDLPPNQPHRAELAKMMVRVSHRGKGIASALVRHAEHCARERGRTLLVLDTADEDGASGFYEKMGYNLTGTIPDYALKPLGGLTGTMIYWKRI